MKTENENNNHSNEYIATAATVAMDKDTTQGELSANYC